MSNPMQPYMQSGGPAATNPSVPTTQAGNRPYIRPAQYEKYFVYVHRFEPLTAAALGVRDNVVTDGDNSEFRIRKQTVLGFVTATGAITLDDRISFEVTPLGERFQSSPMALSLLGSGRFPFVIPPEHLRLPRAATFTAVADSRNSGAVNTTIFVAHHGAKCYGSPVLPQRRYDRRKAWWAILDRTAQGEGVIAANGTVTPTLLLDAESDFEVEKVVIVSDGPMLMQFQNDTDNWFHRPLRSELLGGSFMTGPTAAVPMVSGELPFILPAPRMVTGGGYLAAVLQNLSAVEIRAQVLLFGHRCYPAGGR